MGGQTGVVAERARLHPPKLAFFEGENRVVSVDIAPAATAFGRHTEAYEGAQVESKGEKVTHGGSLTQGLYVSPRKVDCHMTEGTVGFFHDRKGYGFIERNDDDDSEDVFFHMEDIEGPDLEEGQEVRFEVEEADKGPRATNLERI